MKNLSVTAGAQELTAAGVVPGSADISHEGNDWTIFLEVLELGDLEHVTSARVVVEDSTDQFETCLPVCMLNLRGGVSPGAGLRHTWQMAQTPTLRTGRPGAALRVNVLMLEGESPRIKVACEIQATL